MPRLVTAAARHARRLMALSFPTGAWYMRAGEKVMNFVMWLTRSGFRFYVHPRKPSSPPPRRRACVRFSRNPPGRGRLWCSSGRKDAIAQFGIGMDTRSCVPCYGLELCINAHGNPRAPSRRVHDPEVVGSNQTPLLKRKSETVGSPIFVYPTVCNPPLQTCVEFVSKSGLDTSLQIPILKSIYDI
jgi:hypothetical protein